MTKIQKRVLYWTPRILCILFALFLSLFSIDVFGEGLSFWKTILALLIHLVPVYIVVIVLAIAWCWEWIGAILLNALAILYLVFAFSKIHWSAILMISGSLFLVGILFLFNWIHRAQLKQNVTKMKSAE